MNPLTGDLPLHPALVHLPLGISLVVPLLILALLLAQRRLQPAVAALVAALQLVAFVGALVAQETGEDNEESAERQGVPEAALEAHEELAGSFTVLVGLTTAALAIGAALRQRPGTTPVLAIAGALSLAAAVQGARTGHAGGTLVYQHGAGQQAVTAGLGSAAHSPSADGGGHGEDHAEDDD